MRFARACAAVLASSMLCAQEMVVLGGPGRPSDMLGTWLSAHRERFVIADVGLWLHDLCGNDLEGLWRKLEQQRRLDLLVMLNALCARFGKADSRADGLAGVAHVARVLLSREKGSAAQLPEPWRGELIAVADGRPAALACSSDGAVVNWAIATPRGAYDRVEFDALFVATWYLRTCLDRFTAEQRREWQRALDALPVSEQRRASQDDALRALLGTSSPPMPGVIGDVDVAAVLDRAVLAATTDLPLAGRLDLVHRLEPGGGDDLRTSIFRVAHELATAAPQDEWLRAFGPERWRQKWSSLADYAYVAVREVDGIFRVRDIPPSGDRARLLIEPLPEVFAALRRAYISADAVEVALGSDATNDYNVRRLDDALALLAHQRAGTEPPAELVDRMWECVEHGFTDAGSEPVQTRLEGFDGVVRRSGCYLVHVPIRWQGKNEIAVAFHWFVEARERHGDWQRVRR